MTSEQAPHPEAREQAARAEAEGLRTSLAAAQAEAEAAAAAGAADAVRADAEESKVAATAATAEATELWVALAAAQMGRGAHRGVDCRRVARAALGLCASPAGPEQRKGWHTVVSPCDISPDGVYILSQTVQCAPLQTKAARPPRETL